MVRRIKVDKKKKQGTTMKLEHYGYNQQCATFNLNVPRFYDRGDIQRLEYPILVDGDVKGAPIILIKKLRTYTEEYKSLLINMSLESASANEIWDSEIDDLYFFTSNTLTPLKDDSKIKTDENGYQVDYSDDRRTGDEFIVGFTAFEKKGDGEILRYAWLHPFLRGQSLIRSFLTFKLSIVPFIACPPTSKLMDFCMQSALSRWLNGVIQALCRDQELPKELNKHLISQFNFYSENCRKSDRSTMTFEVLNKLKDFLNGDISRKELSQLMKHFKSLQV